MKVKVLKKITSNFTTEDGSDVVILPGEYEIENTKAEVLNLLQRFKVTPTLVEILEEVSQLETKTLHDLNAKELKSILEKKGIEFQKNLKKEELVELLTAHGIEVAGEE